MSDWKVGDRVWVSGRTWSGAGSVYGFAKDDPEVPWIRCDNGQSWDARDLGSVRILEGDPPVDRPRDQITCGCGGIMRTYWRPDGSTGIQCELCAEGGRGKKKGTP